MSRSRRVAAAFADARRIAVFDLDGTLLHGASSERRFAAWLLQRGVLGAPQLAAWLRFLVVHGWRLGRHAPKKDKGYVVGLGCADVAGLAREFIDEALDGALDGIVLAALAAHRERGEPTVLLSGTLQPLAEAVAERLGIDLAIGTLAPERAGRYVLGLPTRHPFGPDKLTLAQGFCADAGIGPERLVAYGDSIHDRFLLERAGEAVAVEPDAALARLARRRGWRLLRHEGESVSLGHPAT